MPDSREALAQVTVGVGITFDGTSDTHSEFDYNDLLDRAVFVVSPQITKGNFNTPLAVDESTSSLRWAEWVARPLSSYSLSLIPTTVASTDRSYYTIAQYE